MEKTENIKNTEGRWDLSFMYRGFDDPKFAGDMQALPVAIEEMKTLVAAEGDEKTVLEAIFAKLEELSHLVGRLSLYCSMVMSVDANDEVAAANLGRLDPYFNDLSLVDSAITRRIGAIDDLEALVKSSPALQNIAFVLYESRNKAAHLIPEAVEPWVLKMQISGGNAFSQLRDKLDATHAITFRGEELPLSGVRGKAYSPDADVRREAYEAEIAAYAKIETPMAACLNSIKMEARTLAELRGYDSVLDMTLDRSRMDRETLDAMLTAIQEYLPDFRRYLRTKAKMLGHEGGLPFYDLFAPVGDSVRTYTIEEARELLLREMGKFTPDMAAFIDHAFEANWIDLYPRAGKVGGAFCAGNQEADRSCVLTNFQGSFSDISTIAHELGHGWHNRCMAGLPNVLTDVPMQLAETASIFNETMLSYQVLSSASPEEQLTLLESSLMEATQTVVDIYSRYLFETEVIETRADHAMSVDELKDAMLRAQAASYGDGLDAEIRHPYMWACKSHYYSSGLNFYNFPYAFGLLFGKGVFACWQKKGDAFVPEYCQLLRSSGSDSIANVAASVGIDVRSVDFWRSSLQVVRDEVDRFCALVEAKKV